MLQLDPMLPVVTPKGPGFAIMCIDYSQEHNLYFVVIDDGTCEIWTWSNTEIRAQKNVTVGRG
jgi:hypothetical protein